MVVEEECLDMYSSSIVVHISYTTITLYSSPHILYYYHTL